MHVECLRFCFLPLIREELNRIAQHWNLHKIRPSLNQESPPGPELREAISYLHTIDEDATVVAEEMCCDNAIAPSDDTFAELAEMVMEEYNLQMPSTASEASILYSELLHHIDSMM